MFYSNIELFLYFDFKDNFKKLIEHGDKNIMLNGLDGCRKLLLLGMKF